MDKKSYKIPEVFQAFSLPRFNKRVLFVVAFGLFLIAFALGLVLSLLPVNLNQEESSPIFFEVKAGQSLSEIAKNLAEKKIIRSPLALRLMGRFKGESFKTGLYYLAPSWSLNRVYSTLATGEVSEKKLTFIEGWRAEQYAQLLAKAGIVNFGDFVKLAKKKEGKLFPDTYRLPARASAEKIIKILEDNYNKKMKKNALSPTKTQLIIASIVEREARNDDERAKIAGVFFNRLALGMRLEADPTVQYARDEQAKNGQGQDMRFWRPLTAEDLRIDSPFNTYLNFTLPPAPIANPGLASIKSAINPEKHNYYYFFHNKKGEVFFSRTAEEHLLQRRREGV